MMEKKGPAIEEKLHALADGELGEEERAWLLGELEKNEELNNTLCDIRRVKDLLDYAYPLEKEKAGREPHGPSLARAAGVLLMVLAGFAGGWLLGPKTVESEGFRLSEVRNDPRRVLLYLGESDPAKFRATLEKVRQLLEGYERQGREVYVVTSAGGVDLLRTATSPVASEIRALKEKYGSLHFVACNNTLFNLRKKGRPVQLVDEAEVAPSAVSFVVNRLKEGWTYLAI